MLRISFVWAKRMRVSIQILLVLVVDSSSVRRTRAANDKRLADLETVETRVNIDGVRAKRGQEQHVEAVQNACGTGKQNRGENQVKVERQRGECTDFSGMRVQAH